MQAAIEMLEEVARVDLEACEAAIRDGDKDTAVRTIERAFAKIDSAIDLLRALPSQ